jgi:hypothetical protein
MSGKTVFAALAFVVLIMTMAAVGTASAAGVESARSDRTRECSHGGGTSLVMGSKAGVNPWHHEWYFGCPPNMKCFDRFETYDLAAETYLGTDGRRHPCRLR